jgi:predicted PurR-regulated permease PerM
MNNLQTIRFEVSNKTIFTILGLILLIWFLSVTYDSLVLILIAFILSSALNPIVEKLVRLRINRTLAVFITVTSVIAGFITLLFFGVNPIVTEISKLSSRFPEIMQNLYNDFIRYFPNIDPSFANNLKEQLTNATSITQILSNISQALISIFQISFTFFLVTILSSFLLLNKGQDTKEKIWIRHLLGSQADRWLTIFEKVEQKLGDWLRGQLFLCLLTGVVNIVLFWILGVDFGISIAILAMLLEPIPSIGQVISTPLGALFVFGLTGNFTLAIIYLIAMIIFHQVKDALIYPKIMERAIGLNPITTLLTLILVAHIPGISLLGIFLAIPIIAVIQLIFEETVLN